MSNSKPSAKRNYKKVCITWGDAFIDTSSFTEDEAKKTEPIMTQTVGFLISKNQHGYVLSTDVYEDSPELATKIFIPKGMVTKVDIL